MRYVILCFIGKSFGRLKALAPSNRAISFLIEGKLNPKKVTNFHFTGMNSVGKEKQLRLIRDLYSQVFSILIHIYLHFM